MPEEISNEKVEGKSAAFEGFGVKINTKGYHLGNLLQMTAIALLGFMTFMIWEQRQALVTSQLNTAAAVKAEHEVIHKSLADQTAAIQHVGESQNEANYILTLSQTQRERLNLQMPPSLRRKARGE